MITTAMRLPASLTLIILTVAASLGWGEGVVVRASKLHNDVSTPIKSQIVVVRTTSDATPEAKERIRMYAKDLSMHSEMHLLVLADAPVSKFPSPLSGIDILRYTTDDITAKFPLAVSGMKKTAIGAALHWNKFMHTESILLSWEYLKNKTTFKLSKDVKLWVFEDDVFLCGNMSSMSQLVEIYAAFSADLLDSGDWVRANPHAGCGTEAYLRKYALSKRVMVEENIERFSGKLLDRLRTLVEQGITAESEWFAPTVVANEGFVRQKFLAKNVGNIHWNSFVPKGQVKVTCQTQTQTGEVKMNHKTTFSGHPAPDSPAPFIEKAGDEASNSL